MLLQVAAEKNEHRAETVYVQYRKERKKERQEKKKKNSWSCPIPNTQSNAKDDALGAGVKRSVVGHRRMVLIHGAQKRSGVHTLLWC
jgi:hypothetical protein